MPHFTNLDGHDLHGGPEVTDDSYASGWTVDIYASHQGTEQLIYRDCSLQTLSRASHLFSRLARTECPKPLAYGQETKLACVLPAGVAAAAFTRIVEWIHAVNAISAHGDVEDPQITTVPADGLTQYLRLLQAADLLELRPPLHNQKRLVDLVRAALKRAFDTRDGFRSVKITDREIGMVWDLGGGDREEPMVRLLLGLFVDAYDVRVECPERYADDIVERFDALVSRNDEFRRAAVDVKTKKMVRLREEERERRDEPRRGEAQRRRRRRSGYDERRGSDAKSKDGDAGDDYLWIDVSKWVGKELNEEQVKALMNRPEEFKLRKKGE